MLNRWVLSRDWKTATEGVEVTRSGRLFKTQATVTIKARSLMADSRVWLTVSEWQWQGWTGTKSLTSLDICHLTKLEYLLYIACLVK